jgi:tripartite-type tricarboxylate transporter receptor subunit TctC
MRIPAFGLLCCLLLFTLGGAAAAADTAAAFYRGRTITLLVGYGPGGGYDSYGRAVARHMGRHIPGNPDIVVKNMPGAGSVRLANYLYNVAEPDGLVFGTFNRDIAVGPLMAPDEARYDSRKLGWIGSASKAVTVCLVAERTGLRTWQDLLDREVVAGATGARSSSGQLSLLLRNTFDAKLKVITGYEGSNEVLLALDRGEVDATCTTWETIKSKRPEWVESGAAVPIVQMSLEAEPELTDVPVIIDLAETDAERRLLRLVLAGQQMGRPFAAPPNLPPERLETLRTAFMATMRDPEFRRELETANFTVRPLSGSEVQSLVEEMFDTPPDVVEAAAAAVRP